MHACLVLSTFLHIGDEHTMKNNYLRKKSDCFFVFFSSWSRCRLSKAVEEEDYDKFAHVSSSPPPPPPLPPLFVCRVIILLVLNPSWSSSSQYAILKVSSVLFFAFVFTTVTFAFDDDRHTTQYAHSTHNFI